MYNLLKMFITVHKCKICLKDKSCKECINKHYLDKYCHLLYRMRK